MKSDSDPARSTQAEEPVDASQATTPDDRGARVVVWATWALLFVTALGYVAAFGSNVPLYDEWQHIPQLIGEEPITIGWLWEQHSEHRMPLSKLVLWLLLRVADNDFRAGLYFNVLALGALSFTMVRVARSLRGRTSYADALLPLALLHWGQYHNLLMSFTVQFICSTVLAGILLLLGVSTGARWTTGRAVLASGCLVLLPLCGANGLGMVPPLAVWLGLTGVLCWRRPESRERRNGVLMLGAGLAALLLTVLYFVGYSRPPFVPANPGALLSLVAGLEFLTVGFFGSASIPLWPFSGAVTLALLIGTAAALAAQLRERPAARCRALGLLFFLAAMACLALGTGWGRAGYGPHAGLASRYVTSASLALVCVYFAWIIHRVELVGRIVQTALLLLSCAVLVPNLLDGLEHGRLVRLKLAGAFERDLRDGVPLPVIIDSHRHLCPTERVAEYMRMLRRAGVGPFRFLSDPEGGLDADGPSIAGWARDREQEGRIVQVDLHADGALLATVMADQPRADLRDAGIGAGDHGFRYPIPPSLRDGNAHAIQMKLAGTDYVLAEYALLVAVTDPRVPDDGVGGALDVADGEVIAGWAWNSREPDRPLRVDIFADETRLATVVADLFRADLRAAGIGDGRHGFRFATPPGLRDGKAHAVRVKVAGTDRVIGARGLLLPVPSPRPNPPAD